MDKRQATIKNQGVDAYNPAIETSIAKLSVSGYTATIKLFGQIPDPDDPAIIEVVDLLEEQQFDTINVVINTPGGSWDTAIMLYSMLKAQQATTFIKTIGISSVYSAGAIIFMAGQERLASYYTDFLIHVTRIQMPYDTSTNSMSYLSRHMDTLKRLMGDLFKPYLTEEEMRLVMDAGSDLYLSELQALEKGIVTHVGYVYPNNYILADFVDVKE